MKEGHQKDDGHEDADPLEEVGRHQNRKDGRFGEAAQLARENPQAAMIPMANRAERDVQKLRRDKRELIATGATREEVRAKEDQITAVMMRLNEAAERRKAGRFAFAESD